MAIFTTSSMTEHSVVIEAKNKKKIIAFSDSYKWLWKKNRKQNHTRDMVDIIRDPY